MGVEFRNNEAAFNEMDDADFTDSDLVNHMKDVLCSVSSGDTAEYAELISVIYHDQTLNPEEAALLVTSLKALSGAVNYIDNVVHDLLLNAIFNMSLWKYKYPDILDAVVELIISLAASSGKYVDRCLDMLIGQFSPHGYFQNSLNLPLGLTLKDQVLSRVHSAIKDIADLVPLSPARLVPIVIERARHFYRFKDNSILMFVENMLKLESGVLGEVVRIPILAGVMDVLLELDVCILKVSSKEEVGWDDILLDDSSKGVFQMELEDVDEFTYDDGLNDGSELPRELSCTSSAGKVSAEKLDSLMVLTFEHLESCEDGGRLIEVFEVLLESFKKTVLPAYKPKFAQFVMFYACSLDPGNCGVTFAMMLEEIFVCSTNPPRLRMSAVAYLASYLSRAKFLSASMVASILERLVDWCFKYVKMQDGGINPEAHRIFYSGCQAIMYLLCFRMRSMMDVARLKSWLVRLPLESILTNKLSPLKVCLPSIVMEFLRQAEAAGLFTTTEEFNFDDHLESEYSRAFGGMERLDMLFPFDPCLLKKSDRYIRPKFVYWSMVQPTYDDDEEDFSDEDVDEAFVGGNEENVMDCEIIKSLEEQHFGFDEFESALNKMSITPKDSFRCKFGGAINQPMRMPSRIRPSTSPESL